MDPTFLKISIAAAASDLPLLASKSNKINQKTADRKCWKYIDAAGWAPQRFVKKREMLFESFDVRWLAFSEPPINSGELEPPTAVQGQESWRFPAAPPASCFAKVVMRSDATTSPNNWKDDPPIIFTVCDYFRYFLFIPSSYRLSGF